MTDQRGQVMDNVTNWQTWDWLYGQTPDFSHNFTAILSNNESVTTTILVHRGKIKEIRIISDSGFAEEISSSVVDEAYGWETFENLLKVNKFHSMTTEYLLQVIRELS